MPFSIYRLKTASDLIRKSSAFWAGELLCFGRIIFLQKCRKSNCGYSLTITRQEA